MFVCEFFLPPKLGAKSPPMKILMDYNWFEVGSQCSMFYQLLAKFKRNPVGAYSIVAALAISYLDYLGFLRV